MGWRIRFAAELGLSIMAVLFGKVRLDGRIPRVAVPFRDGVTEPQIAGARRAGMDIAELRIDHFSDCTRGHVLEVVRRFAGTPVLATIRSQAEGGKWTSPEKARAALFEEILPAVDAIDIELSSSSILTQVVEAARAANKPVVVSFHNFEETPSLDSLDSIANRAVASGADIVKVAALTTTPEDVQVLAQFTLRHRDKGVVTIGMGDTGMPTRIFFPLLGSLFTFASFGEGTAAGQLSLEETTRLLHTFYPSRAMLDKG